MKTFILFFLLGLLPAWSNSNKELELLPLKPDTVRIESVKSEKFLNLYDAFRKSKTFRPFFETFGEDKKYSLSFKSDECKKSKEKIFRLLQIINQVGEKRTEFYKKTVWIYICPDFEKKTKLELSSLFGSTLIDSNLYLIDLANENNIPLPLHSHKDFFKEYQGYSEDFVAKYYRSTILAGLKEIIPQLYSKEKLKELKKPLYFEDMFVKKFCWDDFYENLSWIGLEQTQSFKETIQSNPKRLNIFKAYQQRITQFEE